MPDSQGAELGDVVRQVKEVVAETYRLLDEVGLRVASFELNLKTTTVQTAGGAADAGGTFKLALPLSASLSRSDSEHQTLKLTMNVVPPRRRMAFRAQESLEIKEGLSDSVLAFYESMKVVTQPYTPSFSTPDENPTFAVGGGEITFGLEVGRGKSGVFINLTSSRQEGVGHTITLHLEPVPRR